uniref:Integrase catalytic domain-containing protein n=1 Tax=Quercus lobata TaxID=97700 RepID=A0A7N2LFB2_QUELO
MQIKDYLYGKKLHLPLLGEKPETMKAEEWALLDRQVLGVFRLTLSRFVAHNVVKDKTTADLMKVLSGMYEKLSANNKINLSSIEIDFDDEIRALVVLASLPNSWEAMRMVVSNSIGKEKLKYNDIRDLILAEEIRRRDAGDFGKVYLADGTALDVVDMGDVRILLPNGFIWLLEKVRHIFDLRRNLISVGQLDDEEHAILFVGGIWKVTKGAIALACGKKTVKCLRSDNGGEYIDGGFNEYCAAQGIRTEKTIPRTPQQNDVAERMNRTLNEGARSMRLHAGLLKTFWADVVSTTTYLINRGPSVPMEFRLPEEVWSGKEVKFSHLKVFGHVSYVHIDFDACSKLDAKSKTCFFIGYGDEKFGYRSTVVLEVTEIDQKKSEYVNLDELTGIGKKALHNKWVYRIKRYKARLVVKGFQQKKGINYSEIFSLVVKMSTIRLILGMLAVENLHLEQLDVKTTFLHDDLEEDIYMI